RFVNKMLYKDFFKQVILLFQNGEGEPKEIYRKLNEMLKPAKDEYWMNHYNFGKSSSSPSYLLGVQRIDDIIVNVITPFVYLYADVFSRRSLKEIVTNFYKQLKTSPDNSVVKLVNSQVIKSRKININTPAMEQAAVQLYNFYCVRERCGECRIGKQVFKETGYEYKIIFY